MNEDRLHNVLERCRQRLHPDLSPDLVRETADVQVRYQFTDPNKRTEPLKDLQQLLDEEMSRLGHGGASR